MTKPNYAAMSKQELRAYVLEHRDDLDALEALFEKRPDSKVVKFPFPMTEEERQQQQETLQSLLREKE